MWNKLVKSAAAVFFAVGLTVSAFAAEELPEAAEEAQISEQPLVQLSLREHAARHEAFIHGCGDQTFQPDANLSKAQAAQMLFGLLNEVSVPELGYADVSGDAWYYDAVNTLVCGGVLEWNDGFMEPEEPITRGEFISMAVHFAPEMKAEPECAFTDLQPGDVYYDAIVRAVAAGWIRGYSDGSVQPERYLSRAEATVIVNHMRSGIADRDVTRPLVLSLFDDVMPSHWAFEEIMEAAVSHDVAARRADGSEVWLNPDAGALARKPGLHFIGLEQYYIKEDGRPAVNETVNGLAYGPDGRYTSGNAELDRLVKETLQGFLTEDMTREEALKAAYVNTRDGYTYLRRNYYDKGDNSYTEQEALTMLTTGKGNCYCYAGVFYYLSRQLGYNATAISGTVGYSARPHGWVEIDFDGITYIFDTELEMSYRVKQVYIYDFYKMSYDQIPWPYGK